MDRLKVGRRPIRQRATRLVNECESLLGAEPVDLDDLRARLHALNEVLEKLSTFDQQVLDSMLDLELPEAEQDQEVEECDGYLNKVRRMISKINNHVDTVRNPIRASSPSPSDHSSMSSSKKKSYKLPKVEIKSFGGDILEWLSWWAQFEKIHDDEDLHDSDKFQYLSQAMVMGSKAQDVLKVYPQTAANYPKAIQALRDRFGKEKILVRVYIRELLKMVIANSKEKVSISKNFDKLEGHLKALESLGVTMDQMDLILFPMVESCLPDEILVAWQRSINFGRDGKDDNPPNSEFNYMLEFIKKEVDNEFQREMAKAGFETNGAGKKDKTGPKIQKEIPTAESLVVTSNLSCFFCGKTNHVTQNCFRGRVMSLDEKREKLKQTRACFVCLKRNHTFRNCTEEISCSGCGKRHFKVMCPEVENKKDSKDVEATTVQDLNNISQSSWSKLVLLKTLFVKVVGSNGREMIARILFDDGSQRSYIRSSLARDLKCKALGQFTIQNSLFGGVKSEVKVKTGYNVVVKSLNGQRSIDLKLINEDKICGNCPEIPHGPWIQELNQRKITLNFVRDCSPEIELLIGSDYWGRLMTGRVEKLSCGLVAMETLFGWTLSGQVPSEQLNSIASSVITMLTQDENRSISDLWDLEVLGIRDSPEVLPKREHELIVKKRLQAAFSRDKDGRYVVGLPWIDESISIPNNRGVCEKRLENYTAKLKQQGEYERYNKIFDNWEKEGFIESVHSEPKNRDHFLPHRPVFKPESLTTPVRPVFDASCRVGKNPSLNQCLERGPNMLELIPSILTRFRTKRIGAISDIRKAFQMIGVAERDRDFQKFLWWENSQSRIKEYRHCRVVFGMNCSPFILAAVLEYHFDNVSIEDKPTAELLKRSIYVDNCVVAFDTNEEYEKFKVRSVKILAGAKMDLRQWEFTGEDSGVGSSECGLGSGGSSVSLSSVLGYKWDKSEDTLFCSMPDFGKVDEVTKRTVLSAVAKVYDPLGFLCPALLPPKVLLQESWASSLSWDEKWTTEKRDGFGVWCQEAKGLEEVRIPRNGFGIGIGSVKSVQVHQFCDASCKAYASCVFVRVQGCSGVSVQLLMAKSRLAPLSKKLGQGTTIPRLELLGCFIGSRLAHSVLQSLNMDVTVHHWTDSTIALAWIRRDEDWGTFVGNRVREINRMTQRDQWRHVPGSMNPADLPSRGCTPVELVESKWWEGPSWLRLDKTQWPNQEGEVDEAAVLAEKKKTVVQEINNLVIEKQRFSNFMKNVRVSAWIRRFASNLHIKDKKERNLRKALTFTELRQGEFDLIRQLQSFHYKALPKLTGLNLFMGEDGLYHVRTRLLNRDESDLFKSPILLPADDPLTHQMIDHVHRSHGHAGAQFVLGKIRVSYWIPKGKKTVSRIIRKCIVCKKFSGKNLSSEPAPLPERRTTQTFAFETTGVDLAGPILLRGGMKVWIVIYTCAVYRGVYLDVIQSLSSDEFIESLEKFTMLIGRPSTLCSDQGTNFIGTSNLMKTLDFKDLEKRFGVKPINWSFNPPAAPWWGGFWERLIRTMKDLLRRMTGRASLTLKQLESCLASISYTINNRPLTSLTEDGDDLIPLTPAMFMRDLPVSGLPERDEITAEDLRRSYRKIQDLKSALQNRFRKEYLAKLVQMGQEKKSPEIQVGDIVIVGFDNKKRYQWPLGKIVELCRGRDGKTRVVKVKTSQGVMTRPLERIYPLEIRNPEVMVNPESKGQILQGIKVKKKVVIQEVDADKPPVRTKSGRIVRAPIRYTNWNQP